MAKGDRVPARALTDEEAKAVSRWMLLHSSNNEAIRRRNQLAFDVQLALGLRVSELCYFMVDWLQRDDKGYIVRIPADYQKGGRTTILPIGEQLAGRLLSWVREWKMTPDRNIWGIRARAGYWGEIDRQAWAKMIKRCREELGLEGAVSTHSARKTFANKTAAKLSTLRGNDVMGTIKDLQMAMRHAKVETTMKHYLSANTDNVRAAMCSE